jgi:predicted nucleotidyltransferase
LQIDVFILKELSQFKTKNKKINNLVVKVISLDELIKMKKEAGRPLDLIDIHQLQEIKEQQKL